MSQIVWVIPHAFLSSADSFFKINFLHKFFQEYHQCQIVWIQIRPNKKSGLIRIADCLQKLSAENICKQKVDQ